MTTQNVRVTSKIQDAAITRHPSKYWFPTYQLYRPLMLPVCIMHDVFGLPNALP